MAKTKVKNKSKRLLTVSIPPEFGPDGKRKKGSKPDAIYFKPKDVFELSDAQMDAHDVKKHLKSGRLVIVGDPKADAGGSSTSGGRRKRSGGGDD